MKCILDWQALHQGGLGFVGEKSSGMINSAELHSDLYGTTVCTDLGEGTREKQIENKFCTRGMRLGAGRKTSLLILETMSLISIDDGQTYRD